MGLEEDLEKIKGSGSRDICIVSYDIIKKEKDRCLEKLLKENGFRVRYAGDLAGLMQRCIELKLSGDGTKLYYFCMRIGLMFLKLGRWFQNIGKDPGQTLFCLTSGGNGGDEWLHEVAQIKLYDMGLQDRISFYDHYKGSLQKYEKPVLGYVEYHVSWHCNLNCKGCAHYCNLNREPRFGDIGSFHDNLVQLNRLFDNVETFTLMGGRTLLKSGAWYVCHGGEGDISGNIASDNY